MIGRWLLPMLLLAQPACAGALPQPDHIVIVIEENKSFAQIIGNRDAAYINALASRGTLFTRAYGVTHPSQPNYLALFAGTTFGISSNVCPLDLVGKNLGGSLLDAKRSFALYAGALPRAGAADCIYGAYYRKHNPAADWQELAPYNLPFSDFPQDFSTLPTVALVVPDMLNDMHDGSIAQGDAWLQQNIDAYAKWAMKHNSLLVVTWDEDDGSADNRVATLFVGAMVKRGKSAQRINHYNLLRMIEDMYRLPRLGESATVPPVKEVWRK